MTIIFICHGNICRSVMAEYIFKSMMIKENLQNKVQIYSRAVSNEEAGNDMDARAKDVLRKNGIPFHFHCAQMIKKEELEHADFVFAMDRDNIARLKNLFKTPSIERVQLLIEDHDIYDPWYTGDFNQAYFDIYRGLEGLLTKIKSLIQSMPFMCKI